MTTGAGCELSGRRRCYGKETPAIATLDESWPEPKSY